MAKQKQLSMTEKIRKAISDSGLTHYRIGKDSGVSAPIIDRFVSGEREDIRLATAEKLCGVLGLELVHTKGSK